MKHLILSAILTFLVLSVPAMPRAESAAYKDGDILRTDTVWSGEVSVDGVLFVPEGVTLTIEPGTVVRFTKSDAEYRESGLSESVIPGSGLRVEGVISALGTKDKPVRFTSAEAEPAPGDWGCIYLDHAKGTSFERCVFEYSTYTVHAHFSSFTAIRCIITNNMDGSRLGYSRAEYSHCDITGNTGKGLNFANSRITVRYCDITGNYEGIFLNQKDAACVIEENNIHGNTRFGLSLGEFHDEDVTTGRNWWGTKDEMEIADRVYDKLDDPDIGKAAILPASRPIPNAGVDGLDVKLHWKYKTDGFVDSSPAIDDGRVYFGSWDKRLYCIDDATGEQLWKYETGDCVDSSPAVNRGRVYFGSWDRGVYCLDAVKGRLVWKFVMEPSEFDDHRQSSPVVSTRNSTVIIGGFNGKVYSLTLDRGVPFWEMKTDGPVRSMPLVKDDLHIVGGGSVGDVYVAKAHLDENFGAVGSTDGFLYVFEPATGKLIWKRDLESPVLSTPAYENVTDANLNSWVNLYVTDRDGYLRKLDAVNGNEYWSVEAGTRFDYSSPVLDHEKVITCDSYGRVLASATSDGSEIWSFTGDAGIYSSPALVVSAGRTLVCFGDNAGGVYWLDADTGAPAAVFHAGDAVQGLSAGHDGGIYAGSRDGYLYHLSIEE